MRLGIAARLATLAALVAAVLLATALPASAHASLLSVDPQPGAVYDESPSAVNLRFTEPVEISLGGIRAFDGSGDRIDIGAPQHPDGASEQVRASLPDLDDGTYVVTWRVTSADAHPIEGAFTFQVGPEATADNARGLAARLLSEQGGSTVVGVLYAIDRGLVFASLALLIGGVVFLAAIFPAGRAVRRARRIVWIGLIGGALVSLAGIALEGVYAAALSLSKVFDPSVWSEVIDTRYGKVALVRTALFVAAVPLVRVLLRPGRPLPRWWPAPAALVGLGLAMTPGIAGHASAGDHVALATISDTLHVSAMSCWLGGLVMLVAVVLVRPIPDGLRGAVNRFSALALGAVAVLVVTGGFQSWRQVGSLEALRDTDFGRVLLVKLIVFAAMIVAAAFSREVVNRRFRDSVEMPTDTPSPEPALVGVSGTGSVPERQAGSVPERQAGSVPEPLPRSNGGGGRRNGGVVSDEGEARHLRRSVVVEVVFAAIILAVTSVLVNTAPARTVETEPVSLTMRTAQVFVDATIAPGLAGRNDVHVTVLPNGAQSIADVEVQLTRPGSDLAPFDMPLRQLGPGHYFAPQYNIPFPGDWRIVVRVRLGDTNEVVVTDDFSLR